MSNGIVSSLDLGLSSCKIVGSSGQPLEFRNMVVEFSYYEDIFSCGVSGYLLINDSSNYINIMQFHGNEKLILVLDKPGLGRPIEKILRIYTISNRTQTSEFNENYILRFCSEELVVNEQYNVTKAYQKSTISDIVRDILTNFLSIPDNKIGIIDNTLGLRDLVIPTFNPIQAINWLATFALSGDIGNIGAPFLLYEDKSGFNFRSVLNLYKQPIYNSYTYTAKGLRDDTNNSVADLAREMINVIQYEYITEFDSLNAVHLGVFASKLVTYDPLRLKFNHVDYDYSKYSENAASLDPYTMPISYMNRDGETVNQTTGLLKFAISTTGQNNNKYIKDRNILVNENNPEQTILNRTAQLSLFTANRMKLLLPGDPEMTIGKLIKFNIPNTSTDAHGNKVLDKYKSGKYLVTAVRHYFNQENKYTTIVEICKDSFSTEYGKFDNTNPGWKAIR